ncbi:MAG: hypothetical protein EBU46_00740 [Nitrosomonadaceae bacterium]|nr:hypothetical protein [Nitrosomonadaceae bacterium]
MLTGDHNNPFRGPVAIRNGYYDEDGKTIITAPNAIGDWPVGFTSAAAYDFWANIKSMYYHIEAAVQAEQAILDEALGPGIGAGSFGSMRSGSVVGITRRFWNYTARAPGEHRTYHGANGIVQPEAVGDIRIDFSKVFFDRQSSRPAGWWWYPKIHIAAAMKEGGFTVVNGGSDGYFSFMNPPGVVGAMPSIMDIGITVTTSGSGTPVDAVVVHAADIKPIERYDDITFSPLMGPPGTEVTITLPSCSAAFVGSNLREAFKFVKELWIGDKRIDTFDPATSIQGAFKDTIVVTIPEGATTSAFRFRAAYSSANTDDYYTTREKFVVR